MKNRFAFIDFQNTDSTTKKLLGFAIDWRKLCDFLRNNWKCERVFLYIGVDEGDMDTTAMVEDLAKREYVTVRAKTIFAYKNRNKEIKVACLNCGHTFIERVDMGYNRKSNCDVDLTVDVMDLAEAGTEFYLFTGDGDFEYLIRNVAAKGTKVRVVSSARKIISGPRYYTSRLSTKLRKLFGSNPDQVDFIEINNLKRRIEKS